MKNYLFILFCIGVFAFFPIKSYAMVEVDENGNAISTETEEGEMHIMLTEEGSAPSEGSATVDDGVKPDETVTSTNDGNTSTTPEDEAIRDKDVTPTDSSKSAEGNLLYTATDSDVLLDAAEGKNDNTTLYVVGSGILGIAVGSVGTYLIRKQK